VNALPHIQLELAEWIVRVSTKQGATHNRNRNLSEVFSCLASQNASSMETTKKAAGRTDQASSSNQAASSIAA